MWLTAPNRVGTAGWQVGQSIWMLHASGGPEGLCFEFGENKLMLESSFNGDLPRLEEQFVRGNELHLSFPQPQQTESSEQCDFGFRLVVRPVDGGMGEPTADQITLELLISIQTSLLDTHPTLDLIVQGESSWNSSDLTGPQGSIHGTQNATDASAIVLGPHDAPFTSSIESTEGATHLRLFGEFLEKGVIRRARPWVILNRRLGAISAETLQGAWDALVSTPVPLD